MIIHWSLSSCSCSKRPRNSRIRSTIMLISNKNYINFKNFPIKYANTSRPSSSSTAPTVLWGAQRKSSRITMDHRPNSKLPSKRLRKSSSTCRTCWGGTTIWSSGRSCPTKPSRTYPWSSNRSSRSCSCAIWPRSFRSSSSRMRSSCWRT